MKLLVIAGTHQRENEYSFGVAEKILKQYGKENPNDIVVGLDDARNAEIYELGDFALGIIKPTGVAPSITYLQSLPLEVLANLAWLNYDQRNASTPAYISESNGYGQWTTVTSSLVKAANAGIILDLHSYHERTRNRAGLALQIHLETMPEVSAAVEEALAKAQSSEPVLFGAPYVPQSRAELQRELITNFFDRQTLIKIATSPPQELQDPSLGRQMEEYASDLMKAFKEGERAHWEYDKGWYICNRRPKRNDGLNYMFFEAVHWGETQQVASAKFITNYLVPNLLDLKDINMP